jgi:hypothetical protein
MKLDKYEGEFVESELLSMKCRMELTIIRRDETAEDVKFINEICNQNSQ